MRRVSLIGAWSLVLILTTTLTWQIVSEADERVSDRPVSPLNVDAPVLAGGAPTTTTTGPASPTTAVDISATSSIAPPSTDATTATTSIVTTAPPTTTTRQPASWTVKAITTPGGTVVVRYRPEEVVLQTATPAPGFQAEVEKPGPPDVEVEFETETVKVELRAEWEEGDLKVEISESNEDDS